MKEAAKVIEAISRATGNDKLYLLKKYEDTPNLKAILKFIYNPYCRTGISDAKLAKAMSLDVRTNGTVYHEGYVLQAIEYFKNHTTGSDTDLAYAAHFINVVKDSLGETAWWLACALVTQNLKIGVSVTSLNKAYGADFIPKTGCMLGTLYEDVNPATIAWPCIVTEKLDGIRRVLIKENGHISLFSRSGHPDEGLIEIERDAQYLPDNFVYDGELLAKGTFKDNIAIRQATNSLANSKGTKTGLVLNVFDMVPVDEFYAGKSANKALARKMRLGATLMDENIAFLDERWPNLIAAFGIHKELENIKPVPILGVVNSLAQVEPIVERIWAKGGEGVMLNTSTGYYEIKRSKQLLKIKHTEEHVLPVVDIMEGTGKYEDSMGALVCMYTNKFGQQSYLGVGSGFTDDQRHAIWNNQEAYLGKKVEIECFGESTNAAGYTSLNCPIFKRFVGDTE